MAVCPTSFQKGFEVAENKSHCIHLKGFLLRLPLPCLLCNWDLSQCWDIPSSGPFLWLRFKVGRTHGRCTRYLLASWAQSTSGSLMQARETPILSDSCLSRLLEQEWNMNLWRYLIKQITKIYYLCFCFQLMKASPWTLKRHLNSLFPRTARSRICISLICIPKYEMTPDLWGIW